MPGHKSLMEIGLFLIGLLVGSCATASVFLVWPEVMGPGPLAATIHPSGHREIRESAAPLADGRTDIKFQWFETHLRQITAALRPEWWRDLKQMYVCVFELPTLGKVRALWRDVRAKLTFLLTLCHRAQLLVSDEFLQALVTLNDVLLETVREER